MIVCKKTFFIAIIFVCVFACGYVCTKRNRSHVSHTMMIVATTTIIADAVKNIVGDCAHVDCLMGPGIDPHTYRARESDVHTLAAADLIFYNGLHLEGKMGHVLEGMNRFTTAVAISDALDHTELRAAEIDGMYDPHIWFDVSLWIKAVALMQRTLIEKDPEHAHIYQHNGDQYMSQLHEVHAYVKEHTELITPEKRILITAHDAFGYFGRAYGFTVVGLQGLSTDADISTRDIQQLADYIVENKVRTVFVESAIPARALVAVQHAVAARGWSVALGDELYTDALGDDDTPASSYISMVKYTIDTFINSLAG